jgi:3-deoxy-D-manno-octulosonic-acid transferase
VDGGESLSSALATAMKSILQDQQQRGAMSEAALRYAAQYRGATMRIMAALKELTT